MKIKLEVPFKRGAKKSYSHFFIVETTAKNIKNCLPLFVPNTKMKYLLFKNFLQATTKMKGGLAKSVIKK